MPHCHRRAPIPVTSVAVSPPAASLALACPGALHWSSGHEYLLIALRALLDDGRPAHLALRGDGPDGPRVLFTIADLGLTDAVTFVGESTADPVVACLRGARVAVLPALCDGPWPELAVAVAAGLAVVTADRPGCRSALVGGRAELVSPRHPAGIAAAALRLSDGP